MRGNIRSENLTDHIPSAYRVLKRSLHFIILLLISDFCCSANGFLALCVDDFRFLTGGTDIFRYFLHFPAVFFCRFFYRLKTFQPSRDCINFCLRIGDLTRSAFFIVELALFFEHLQRIVHSANITVTAYKVGQFCGYGFVVAFRCKCALGKVDGSLKSVCIYTEQTLAKSLGKICGYSARCGIVESIAVICCLGGEASFNAICLTACAEGQTASANTAAPRKIVFSVILLKACLLCIAHSVQHDLDKRRKRGLAAAVICSNTVEAVFKAEFLFAYFSEVFNVTFY